MARKKRTAKKPNTEIQDYRHDTKRVNNPPAGIAARGKINEPPKVEYAYNPHRPPCLRFDENGEADRLPELLQKAKNQVLSEEEVNLLNEALQQHEPWLEWSGKQETQSFTVDPVALHIHERVSAKAIMKIAARENVQRNLFADPQLAYNEAVQFYQHDVEWANRLILGDSLTVMSSLAHREDLGGKVQTIYFDPPYGIKFASNFQPTVFQRNVTDKPADLTREPEQIQAYRDTWHLGVHSYLAYLRDRLIVARDLLTDSGSIFVQIGDENVHNVRCVLDEVFGPENYCSQIAFQKSGKSATASIPGVLNYLLWYARDRNRLKTRKLLRNKSDISKLIKDYDLDDGDGRKYRLSPISSQHYSPTRTVTIRYRGREYHPGRNRQWSLEPERIPVLLDLGILTVKGNTIFRKLYLDQSPGVALNNLWEDTSRGSFGETNIYVVQTTTKPIQRCILMTTDPGDLVLDPTCGSGTTAYVAEQWGRRWITIDTSRVAIALARQRLLTSSFDYYQFKEPSEGIAGGFVNKAVPHITLKSIAKNDALDPIFAKHEPILAAKLEKINRCLAAVGGGASFVPNCLQNWRRSRSAKGKNPSQRQTGGDGFFPKLHGKSGRCRLTRMPTGPKHCALR